MQGRILGSPGVDSNNGRSRLEEDEDENGAHEGRKARHRCIDDEPQGRDSFDQPHDAEGPKQPACAPTVMSGSSRPGSRGRGGRT